MEQRKLRAVAIAELGKFWDKIYGSLKQMSGIAADGWMPEDIYMALMQQNAALFVAEGDEWDGFIIFQVIPEYAKKRLHIWVATCFTSTFNYMDAIKDIAKTAGCSRITFDSSRRGWNKRAVELGFKEVTKQFSLDLGD